ncbi:unnamed protein product, partial [Scytosiphon promiscuus]
MPKREEWRTYLGRYEVSSLGNIRRKHDQFQIKKRRHPSGYTTCTIYCGGKHVPLLVHRIVTYSFLGNPPDSTYTVDHINRVRSDNRLINLRWCNKKDQSANTSLRQPKVCLKVRSTGEMTVDYKS